MAKQSDSMLAGSARRMENTAWLTTAPDVVILMTDEERAIPPYESADVLAWRRRAR